MMTREIESTEPYRFREWELSADVANVLRAYALRHVRPRDETIEAAICNEFGMAALSASGDLARNLPALAAWLYWEAPSACHGSRARFHGWAMFEFDPLKAQGGCTT